MVDLKEEPLAQSTISRSFLRYSLLGASALALRTGLSAGRSSRASAQIEETPMMKRWTLAAGGALLLGAIAVFLLESFALHGQLDDAYISYRYARNLVEGTGLVFNAGEYVEGFTNLLWTLLVAVGLAFGAEAGSTCGTESGAGSSTSRTIRGSGVRVWGGRLAGRGAASPARGGVATVARALRGGDGSRCGPRSDLGGDRGVAPRAGLSRVSGAGEAHTSFATSTPSALTSTRWS